MGRPDIYRKVEKTEPLCQGDILLPNELRENLLGHQEYFANSPHFYRYVVLTQTCDLEREDDRCNFIFLSVARKLGEAIGQRDLETSRISNRTQRMVRDLLMFQYNKRGFFYLPSEETQGVDEPLVIDLRVIFSLHKSHHGALVSARRGGLNDFFAAQLGQLTAQMFNRIAIPDVDTNEATEEAAALVKSEKAKQSERIEQLISTSTHKKCSVAQCEKKAETFRWIDVKSPVDEGKEEVIFCFEHAKQLDVGSFSGALTLKET